MACVSWCDYDGTIPDKPDGDSRLATWEIVLATFSNWFRNEILGILEGQAPTIPGTLYVAANSGVSSAISPGAELSGDGYARALVTFERVSDIKRWNPTAISLPLATAPWTVLSFTLWDSPTIGAGNYYAFGNLAAPTTVSTNNAITFAANRLIIGMGSGVV